MTDFSGLAVALLDAAQYLSMGKNEIERFAASLPERSHSIDAVVAKINRRAEMVGEAHSLLLSLIAHEEEILKMIKKHDHERVTLVPENV